MKAIIILSVIAVVFGVIAVIACIKAVKSKQELNKHKKQEKANAKIDKETVENINVVAGGDIHAGNDILHELAEKRR